MTPIEQLRRRAENLHLYGVLAHWHELADSEIILTVASNPEPVDDINNVDISNFGLFIECDDSSKTVIVPAEYRTASKVIKLTGNRQCRYYKFRSVTIK